MRSLFAHLIAGDADAMLADLDAQHGLGVDPLSVLRGLLAMVHGITLHKSIGRVRTVHGEEDRAALAQWAERLGHASLHRLWQLLLKGHDETEHAPNPREACEMALLRVLHAATMPDPGTLARRLAETTPASAPDAGSGVLPPAGAPAEGGAPWNQADDIAVAPAAVPFQSAAELVALLDAAGRLLLAGEVRNDLRLVEIAPGRLSYQSATGQDDYVPLLREALSEITGKRWQVERGNGEAQPSLAEQERLAEQALRNEILGHPLVKATQAAFPEAEIDWNAAEFSPHDAGNPPTRSAKA
jgi:DNA polymerase-3 subunit gamma/tau